MNDTRTRIISRIYELFSDLNSMTTFKSRYWKDTFFWHKSNDTQIEIEITLLENYFKNMVTKFTDDELLELLEFIAIQTELFDVNGYN